jgi:oligosaccharide reducing-end xylanase
MSRALSLLCGVTAIILAWSGAVQAQPTATTPASTAATVDDGTGAGAYRTQRYRNLFAERLGRSPQETHARIERTFQQLFHGDGQEQRVYFETGANENGPLYSTRESRLEAGRAQLSWRGIFTSQDGAFLLQRTVRPPA